MDWLRAEVAEISGQFPLFAVYRLKSLKFGHFGEQFPWVDPHPACGHPLPKGEGVIHDESADFKGTNRRFMTQWQGRGMKRRFEPHAH
ncbi:MAG: hypothetical protein DMG06_18055 [Acidobacteria bacterium]|nr:MAG: hypothetical protein DMG06_18055 [Acidobacteriota bacterium]